MLAPGLAKPVAKRTPTLSTVTSENSQAASGPVLGMALWPPVSPWATHGYSCKKKDPGPELVEPEPLIFCLFRAWSEVPKVRVELTRGYPHRFLSLMR